MNPLEDAVRDALISHESDAPSSAGMLDALRRRGARTRRRRQFAAIILAGTTTTLITIGVAATRTAQQPAPGPDAVPAVAASPTPMCPGLAHDTHNGTASPAPAPQATATATPTNSPGVDALAEAVGQQGHGAFADTFGLIIVDQPPGRVSLCITDVERGAALAQAAKRASPDIDLSKLDIYRCDYTQRAADAAIARLVTAARNHTFPYPLYNYAFSTDGAAIEVSTTAEGSTSQQLRAALTRVNGGIPVRMTVGSPDAPL